MAIHIIYKELAAAPLTGEEETHHPHGHAPVDFHTGADALVAEHHVDAHGTAVAELPEVLLPPLADVHQTARVGILCQPGQLLRLGCQPVAGVCASLIGVEERETLIFHASVPVEHELQCKVGNLVEHLLGNDTPLLLHDVLHPAVTVGRIAGHQPFSAAAPGCLEQRSWPLGQCFAYLSGTLAFPGCATKGFAQQSVGTHLRQGLHCRLPVGEPSQVVHLLRRGQQAVGHSCLLQLMDEGGAPSPGADFVPFLQLPAALPIPHQVALLGPPFGEPVQLLAHLTCAGRGCIAWSSVGQRQIILRIENMHFHAAKLQQNVEEGNFSVFFLKGRFC